MRRFFRKLNLNKRKIWSVGIITIIFVMSLGYAALSQHMDIDSVTVIDRNWIVKITNVNATEINGGIDNSHTYVSSTATFNVTLPNSSSKVAYDVTISNQGNLVAKLSSIEVIEDKNSGIKYEINSSSIKEGDLIKPGKSTTVNLYIGYGEGVENVSNTEKSIMITFNFIEDVGNSINGSGNVPITGQNEYSLGEEVTLVDGSRWYVVNDSGSDKELVTLFAATSSYECAQFDSNGYGPYNMSSPTNIGYCLNNTYLNKLKTNLTNAGGNTRGLAIRLLTMLEVNKFSQINDTPIRVDKSGQITWLMPEEPDMGAYRFLGTDNKSTLTSSPAAQVAVRPVITILKSNVLSSLADKILADNTEQSDTSIDFSISAGSTNGNGLYYRTSNTEGSKPTYYFRGAVTNNYVSFAGKIWRIVRINEDGSVRLILNDNIGTSAFNPAVNSNKYAGYMYGKSDSIYADAHKNKVNSTVKNIIDSWYIDNISKYSQYISTEAGFCGDRQLDVGTGAGTTDTLYIGDVRVRGGDPYFKCTLQNDLYTTGLSDKGNNALLYPIGMLSADEVKAAGAGYSSSGGVGYLTDSTATQSAFWTITPVSHISAIQTQIAVSSSGFVFTTTADSSRVRPVINLSPGVGVVSGGTGTSSNPYVIKTNNDISLVEQILSNNSPQPDNVESQYVDFSWGISFGSASSDTNGKGLYYTSTNTENSLPTYYFRGNVTNNNVYFMGSLWKIVRINEDGSVRLVLDGINGTSAFNSTSTDNAYVGYMIGTVGATSSSSAHTNTTNSTIRTYLENTYANSPLATTYAKYLANPGFCNDRTLNSGLGYGKEESGYMGRGRLFGDLQPQFRCPRDSDLFTTGYNINNRGNSMLTMPIGLLTMDEVSYAGSAYVDGNNYLSISSSWWTMTPSDFNGTYASVFAVTSPAEMFNEFVTTSLGVRPVINFVNGIKITDGNGTEGRPYLIKTD